MCGCGGSGCVLWIFDSTLSQRLPTYLPTGRHRQGELILCSAPLASFSAKILVYITCTGILMTCDDRCNDED